MLISRSVPLDKRPQLGAKSPVPIPALHCQVTGILVARASRRFPMAWTRPGLSRASPLGSTAGGPGSGLFQWVLQLLRLTRELLEHV